jgi:hypothetical protein
VRRLCRFAGVIQRRETPTSLEDTAPGAVSADTSDHDGHVEKFVSAADAATRNKTKHHQVRYRRGGHGPLQVGLRTAAQMKEIKV